MKRMIVIALAVCAMGTAVRSGDARERTTPVSTESGVLTVRFNGDAVTSHYRLFDARSAEEKERDIRTGRLAGSLAVFFHGHARRPDDADVFLGTLALRSKSGLVLVPVCDTPCGRNPLLRGDAGKEVVLMEVVRQVLNKHGMSIHGYTPAGGKEPVIDTADPQSAKNIPVSLLAVGYSHGGILARTIASKHPYSVTGLAQICPAGYIQWGDNSCGATSCLATAFTWECIRIAGGYFDGNARQVHNAAWGGCRGFSGDCLRSWGSCLTGNTSPMCGTRIFRDMKECTGYLDDRAAPVPLLKSITVIFAEKDTLFRYWAMGIEDPRTITREEAARFWTKYYPASLNNGSSLTLRVLPGNHIGLQLHPRAYVEAILGGSGQLQDDAAAISSRQASQ